MADEETPWEKFKRERGIGGTTAAPTATPQPMPQTPAPATPEPPSTEGGDAWQEYMRNRNIGSTGPSAPKPAAPPPKAAPSTWEAFKAWGRERGWDDVKTAGEWLATRGVNLAAGVGDMALGAITGQGPLSPMPPKIKGVDDPKVAAEIARGPFAYMTREGRKAGKLPNVDTPGTAGKIFDAGFEGVMGGLGLSGGRSALGVLSNLLGGAAGEAAGQATEGTAAEPAARALGGVLGGALPSSRAVTRSPASRLAREATEHMTPQEWALAEQFQREARAGGIPIMTQEAIGRSTADPVAQLFGHVGATPQGAAIPRTAADRIPGIRAAVGDVADLIAHPGVDPKTVDRQLGAAADAAVRRPLAERSQAASPHYLRAQNEDVPATVAAGIAQQIDDALTRVAPNGSAADRLRELRAMVATPARPGWTDRQAFDHDLQRRTDIDDAAKAAIMRQRHPGTPERFETNVGRLDEAFKDFSELMRQRAFEPTTRVTEAGRTSVQPILEQLREDLVANNLPYRRGTELYRGQGTGPTARPSPYTTAVEEAQRSSMPQIAAGHEGTPGQAFTAFTNEALKPGRANPATVADDMARLRRENPMAAREALRQHIDTALDDAFKPTQGGEQLRGGANFAVKFSGAARDNMQAAIEGATGNRTTALGFTRLLEILDRTGVTPGVGSPTQTRGAMMQEAGRGGLVQAGTDALNLSRGSIAGTVGNYNFGLRQRATLRQLADVAVDPAGVRRLHELALLNPDSARARALAASIWEGVHSVANSDRDQR